MSILIKNGTLVTMNPQREVFQGNIYIENDRIAAIGRTPATADQVIDASGQLVIPGLIQPHIHLCQALFRGRADDLELLDWLRLRIWPLEGAHDPESLYYSALLGISELFLSGTTTIVDMESVHHTEAAIEAIAQSGIRAITGKVMMDFGDDVPASLKESTDASLKESVDLLEKWHGYDNGRIQYAFEPRFVVSCTEELLLEVRDLARHYGVKIHTHASENRGECALVEKLHDRRNVLYLDDIGLTGPDLILVHCIWLSEEEKDILARTGTKVVHCPSSNLKMASGICPVPDLLSRGTVVSLAADGAPNNNNLDAFMEMRLAALIQKPIHGPTSMPAPLVFEMATLGGARAMGMEKEIGSLEVGKKADLAIVSLAGLHTQPAAGVNVYTQLVYQARGSDVTMTMVDGKIVMERGELKTIDAGEVRKKANEAVLRVAQRAGLA
ncbi:5-methylthioadenosine/S-adenosylhomocysteine deaminase [Moorella glycerini]|uniref:5-methylthioadenosine/S-adenosylhomocysteine deaminase n=1 Tax=Neomoorella stamsii TaxID=1266720 RepID=A0A9X7J1X5_9FIRM|nr:MULTISPECIES: 5'-deoxyadenosine deaminase [Moorella]PRR71346.1 5-methylthioadenosine/S-adenosylhomocysteine deaminase [Moorella stamsii]CEP66592.1 5-methylthioadenosine/S-adenosylhomocysteine deaminase [Moorella glycerini]